MGNAAEPEADAGEQCLHQRGQYHAQGDAADRLTGEADGSLASFAAETMREREDAARGRLAVASTES